MNLPATGISVSELNNCSHWINYLWKETENSEMSVAIYSKSIDLIALSRHCVSFAESLTSEIAGRNAIGGTKNLSKIAGIIKTA